MCPAWPREPRAPLDRRPCRLAEAMNGPEAAHPCSKTCIYTYILYIVIDLYIHCAANNGAAPFPDTARIFPCCRSRRLRRRARGGGKDVGSLPRIHTPMTTDPNAPDAGAPSGMSRSEYEVRANLALQ